MENTYKYDNPIGTNTRHVIALRYHSPLQENMAFSKNTDFSYEIKIQKKSGGFW